MMLQTPMAPRRAFSLVEVLVAMLLLMIGVLGLVTQWPMGARLVYQSEWYSEASTLGERTLERLDALPWPPVSGNSNEGRYLVTWTVSRGPIANTLRADVVVSGTWMRRPHSLRMGTILSAKL